MKLMKDTLSTVSKMTVIAIGVRKLRSRSAIFFQMAIEIAILNLIKIEIENAISIFAIGVMPCTHNSSDHSRMDDVIRRPRLFVTERGLK